MKKILLIFICMSLVHISFAQWAGMASGPGGKVRALCVHNGELYAGGDFTGLVKKWTGTTWVAVGSLTGATTPRVNALISFNGSLYAGGCFTVNGIHNVAKWTGSAWSPIGEGLQGVAGQEVRALCNYQGSLLAGGNFIQSGSNNLAKVAKLVGNGWTQVGGGAPTNCTNAVNAMTVHSSELYVAGEGSAPFINKLDLFNGQWDNMPNGITSGTAIYALGSFKHPNATTPSLFIGGAFSAPFTLCCSYSNGFWGTVLNPFSGTKVTSLIATSSADTGDIVAGGLFTVQTATNLAIKPIAAPWKNVGTNTFDNAVLALCYYNGYLVAGGDFTTPGANIARYATTIGIDELNENLIVNNVFPNPVINNALLKVQTKNEMLQPELLLMDVNGNEISNHATQTSFSRSQNQVEYRLDREGLASGIYYYMLIDQQEQVASGKFVIE